MGDYFGGPRHHIEQILTQIESADGDGWNDLLGIAREALEETERLAVRDERRKEALRLVRAMARAIQRKDKRKAIRSGRDALKEFEGAES
jgi:hypothetical protein